MLVHAVLWHGALIGLYTCATDAAVASKALNHSTVVTCHLNAETTNGAVLLQEMRPTIANHVRAEHCVCLRHHRHGAFGSRPLDDDNDYVCCPCCVEPLRRLQGM